VSKVLIGFLTPAYLTLIIAIIYYLVAADQRATKNLVDQLVIKFLTRNKTLKLSQRWGESLEKIVLMFSDIQVITGIAILAGAFSQLRCGISVYHWQILVYLAWFSSLTHLTSLTLMRQFFMGNSLLRYSRIFLMFATIALLVVALLPTGMGSWFDVNGDDESTNSLGQPAKCYYEKLRHVAIVNVSEEPQSVNMVFEMTILVFSYAIRTIKMFQRSSDWTTHIFKEVPSKFVKQILDYINRHSHQSDRPLHWIIAYQLLLTGYVSTKALLEFYNSLFWEVC
jgi:hypothetical protein